MALFLANRSFLLARLGVHSGPTGPTWSYWTNVPANGKLWSAIVHPQPDQELELASWQHFSQMMDLRRRKRARRRSRGP